MDGVQQPGRLREKQRLPFSRGGDPVSRSHHHGGPSRSSNESRTSEAATVCITLPRSAASHTSNTFPVFFTDSASGAWKSAALLLPIDEDTDLETLILSNSRRFWELFDRAAQGHRTPMDDLPAVDDEEAWGRIGKDGKRRKS